MSRFTLLTALTLVTGLVMADSYNWDTPFDSFNTETIEWESERRRGARDPGQAIYYPSGVPGLGSMQYDDPGAEQFCQVVGDMMVCN